MKFCSKCGNQLLDEAVVCPKCGCATEKVSVSDKAKKPTNANTAKGAALIIAGLIVIVAFIILVASQL